MTNRQSVASHDLIHEPRDLAGWSGGLSASGMWGTPFEIEAALSEHPSVAETAVVGRADVDGFEKPAAWVVLKPEPVDFATLEAELVERCRARLAPYKFPRWFHFVSKLPKTNTGILLRNQLRGETP